MTRFRHALRWGLSIAALLTFSSCVAHDIGHGNVQSSLHERTGYRAHWNHVAADQPGSASARRLLEQPLTADMAAQVALLNNPEVQAAFEELGLERAELVRALALPNPTAEAGVQFGPAEESPEIELAVMIDLTELITLPWKKQAADSSLAAAQARVAAELMDLVLGAKRGFFEYQAAEQRLALQKSVVQAAGATLVLAEELYSAGNIAELDFMLEKARYEEARLELARAEAAQTSARERLNQLMGLWGHGTHWRAVELAEALEAPGDLADVERRALQHSLDLEQTKQAYAAFARQANLATLRGVLPELRAGVGAERQEDEWSVGPAIELELPIFYQGQAEVAIAEAQMRRQRSLHEALAVRLRAAVRTASRNLVVAHDAALHYRDHLLPERERIVEQTQLMFNAMSVGAFELLQAKRDQVRTASAYVDALRDYWVTRAELDQLLAGRLVEVQPLASVAAGAGEAGAGAEAH